MSNIYLLDLKNKHSNLEILIDFYKNVWCEYNHYYENDKLLYSLFFSNNYSPRLKALILNKLYSAGMKDIQLINFSEQIESVDLLKIEPNQYIGLYNDGSLFNSKLTSLESKYLHWKNEVNNSQFSPIFDSNVTNELQKYQYKKINEFSDLKINIDCFIKEYLSINDPENQRIELKCGLHDAVSVYRLVDKYLWLSNKIRMIGDNKSSQAKGLIYIRENQYKDFICRHSNIIKLS
jgi:hypothetical protein